MCLKSCVLGVLLAFAPRAGAQSAGATQPQTKADEELLQEANVGLSGDKLLAYLRGRSLMVVFRDLEKSCDTTLHSLITCEPSTVSA